MSNVFTPKIKIPLVSGIRKDRGLVVKPKRASGIFFGGYDAMEDKRDIDLELFRLLLQIPEDRKQEAFERLQGLLHQNEQGKEG